MKILSVNALALKITFLIAFLSVTELKAQFKYGGKIELGRMWYFTRTMTGGDSEPGYMPARLKEGQNGIEISAVNGFRFREVLFVGLGVGYLNYQGVKGYSIYGDIEALTSKKKLATIFGFRAGSSNLKGYENSGTVEFNIGVNYRPVPKIRLYLKGGLAFAHRSTYAPVRLGIGF